MFMTTLIPKRGKVRKTTTKPQVASEEDELMYRLRTSSVIDLSRTNLGDVGARKVAENLSSGHITNLQMSWNSIWADGARALASALSVNETIVRLDLGHNNIGNYGASYIADCLSQNNTLTALYLNDNGIDDEGAQCLLANINDKLCELSLVCNPITDRSVLARIQEKLEANKYRRRSDAIVQKENRDSDVTMRLQEELKAQKAVNEELQRSIDHIKTQHQRTLEKMTRKHKQVEKTLLDDHTRELDERVQAGQVQEATVDRLREELRSAEARAVRAAQDSSHARADEAAVRRSVQELSAMRVRDAASLRSMTEARDNCLRRQRELEQRLIMYDICHMHEDTSVDGLSRLEEELEAVLRHVRAVKVKKVQLENMSETKKCKVCFEERIDTLLLPCAHLIMCQGCSNKVDKCPLCSKAITSRVHVFEG